MSDKIVFFVREVQEKDNKYDSLVASLYEINEDVAKAVALWYFLRPASRDTYIDADIDKFALRRVFDEFCKSYDVVFRDEHAAYAREHWTKTHHQDEKKTDKEGTERQLALISETLKELHADAITAGLAANLSDEFVEASDRRLKNLKEMTGNFEESLPNWEVHGIKRLSIPPTLCGRVFVTSGIEKSHKSLNKRHHELFSSGVYDWNRSHTSVARQPLPV